MQPALHPCPLALPQEQDCEVTLVPFLPWITTKLIFSFILLPSHHFITFKVPDEKHMSYHTSAQTLSEDLITRTEKGGVAHKSQSPCNKPKIKGIITSHIHTHTDMYTRSRQAFPVPDSTFKVIALYYLTPGTHTLPCMKSQDLLLISIHFMLLLSPSNISNS